MYLEKSDTKDDVLFIKYRSNYLNSITKAQNIVSLFRITLNPRKKKSAVCSIPPSDMSSLFSKPWDAVDPTVFALGYLGIEMSRVSWPKAETGEKRKGGII